MTGRGSKVACNSTHCPGLPVSGAQSLQHPVFPGVSILQEPGRPCQLQGSDERGVFRPWQEPRSRPASRGAAGLSGPLHAFPCGEG